MKKNKTKKIKFKKIIITIIIGLLIGIRYFIIYNPSTLTSYYPNGQIRYIYHNGYGLLHGKSVDYYENGQIYRIHNHKFGQLHGKSINYYENGQIADIKNYRFGKLNGKVTHYRPNGNVKGEWYYKKGIPKDGEFIEYYDSGEILRKVKYTKGKIEGDDIRYYKNGDIQRIGNKSEQIYYDEEGNKTVTGSIAGFLYL